MNDSNEAVWPTLVATEPDDIRCPICGGPVDGQEIYQPIKQVFDEIELWPGGPIYQDPGLMKREMPDGKPIWTVTPYGHRIGGAEFTGRAAEHFFKTVAADPVTNGGRMRIYTFEERHPKSSGPWQDEPDKAQWIDEATDLDCLIVRNHAGALCGYVGVPPGHPWHGKDYGECVEEPACGDCWCDHSPGARTEVHGGLTFAGPCQEGAEDGPGICHVPEPDRPANVWWLGFDCNHYMDIAPLINGPEASAWCRLEGTYKTFAYVQNECRDLARQVKAAA